MQRISSLCIRATYGTAYDIPSRCTVHGHYTIYIIQLVRVDWSPRPLYHEVMNRTLYPHSKTDLHIFDFRKLLPFSPFPLPAPIARQHLAEEA
ncbi:hypothetical protein I7I53_03743 [Histoplasma capsulatum var. duboisii H88]|uniref:Uncharacterized protein n=1 Tax=Ajellomyces capsulatus (strain H88) TaxID=544711 RepID=A0A8A1LP56_AJEC8|nr:hypothetical protein I7I53_03743 [Histoplasma capsulatum var. duboisii H88]